MENNNVFESVMRAVDEVNEMLPQNHRINKSIDTALLGSSASINLAKSSADYRSYPCLFVREYVVCSSGSVFSRVFEY